MEQFSFQAKITRAVKKDGKIIIDGVASSDAIDTYDSRFNKTCQEYWEKQINDNAIGLPVLVEINHDGLEDWTKRCGRVTRATLVDKTTVNGATSLFEIQAEIDGEHYLADTIYRAITNPKIEYGQPQQLAFSINGLEIGVESKIINENGKEIEEYSKIPLFAIGIVEYASNPDAADNIITAIKRSRNKENEMANENKTVDNNVTPVVNVEATTITRADSASVETPQEVIQEAVNNMNDIITELLQEVLAISESTVKPENILFIINSFLCKYSDNISWNLMMSSWKLDDLKRENMNNTKRMAKEKLQNLIRNVNNNSKTIIENLENDKKEDLKVANENTADVTVKTVENAEVKPNVERSAEPTVENTAPTVNAAAENDLSSVLRSMSDLMVKLSDKVENLTKEVESVKTEKAKVEADNTVVRQVNQTLQDTVQKMSVNPTSTPANQIVEGVDNVERELTEDDILKLYAEGKLDKESSNIVKGYLVRKKFGLNNLNLKV